MLRRVIALYLVFQLIFQGSLFFEIVSQVVGVKGAWAGPICVQPEGAVKPAEFDAAFGYCVTPPLTQWGKCPGFYVFKPEVGACIANPICSGVEYWDVNRKQCVSVGIGGDGSGDGFGLDPNKSYCAVDLNGDGEIQREEIRECLRTQEGGYLCPLQMAKCNVNYVCPSGSYNPSTGKCEANANIVCPSGSSYNPSTGKCEYTPIPAYCLSQEVNTTKYRCPVNNIEYASLNDCEQQCRETATCVPQDIVFTGTLSITNPFDCSLVNRIIINGNGNTLTITIVFIQFLHMRTVTSTLRVNTSFSGYHEFSCPGVNNGCVVNEFGVITNGDLLIFRFFISDLTGKSYSLNFPIRVHGANFPYREIITRYWMKGFFSSIHNLTIQPTPGGLFISARQLADGIFVCAYPFPPVSDIVPYSSTLFFCPLGNYQCSGSPPVCHRNQACVTFSSKTINWLCSSNNISYSQQDQCLSNCFPICNYGGIYNITTGKCEIIPQFSCPSGMTYNSSNWKCESTADIQHICPLDGSVNKCLTYNGEKYCSLINCINPSQIQDDEPDIIPSGFMDDGARDNEGNCLGDIYIFNGKGMRCKTSGIQTGFQNCCNKNRGILQDNFGGMSVLDIKYLIEGLYGLYRTAQIAKYAYDLGRGALVLKNGPGFVFLEKNIPWGGEVARFAVQTPEASALSVASTISGGSEAASAALQTYLNPQINPNVALAVTKLAISQVIQDPMLASLANLAATFIIAPNPVTIALAVVDIFLALFSGSCDQQDIMTATLQKSGYCHYVGTRCLKRWPLAGCVQRARVYCCFNSKLARIIHEQGRPQLGAFVSSGIWGSPKNPYCRGFTPEEFQALDFGKIDLSEYYGDIIRNINQNVENTINRNIQPTIDALQKYRN
ncbi:MAG: conjugal transfer protein TraN [Archaeoglobaceae archaeon]